MFLRRSLSILVAGSVSAALSVVALVALDAPAQAAVSGSVVVYQCGGSVCAMDPDVPGSSRVVATNAKPAGVTRDGRTAGVVDNGSQTIREIAIAPGGFDRTMATPGSADPPDFASISDSGASVSWVWYYPTYGWFAQVVPFGGTRTELASSTSQLSVGWKGEQMLSTRRGAAGYDSRICLEAANGPGCDTLLASEPDRNLHAAFPDINPAGNTVVAVRGPESTGFGLPYYGSLALYAVGGGPTVITNGQDSQPEFSSEGNRVVFERQDQGIWVVNTDGSGAHKIADGTTPFWGGTATETAPPQPPANTAPVGSYDAAVGGQGTIRVNGWAFDPDVSSTSIDVLIAIGGQAGPANIAVVRASANLVRADVNQANGITGNHGFDVTAPTAKRGTVPICVYAENTPAGTNTLLGCKDTTVTDVPGPPAPPTPNAAPVGAYDAATGGDGTIRVSGWGFDPDESSTSIDVQVAIGGEAGPPNIAVRTISANLVRADVNQANGITGNHGFDLTAPTAKRGTVPVCIYLVNKPAGTNTRLGCKNTTVTGAPTPMSPAASPAKAGGLAIGSAAALQKVGGSLVVPVSCPAPNPTGCAGSLSVTTAKKYRAGGAGKRRQVVVATGSYQLAPGGQTVMKVKLTKQGKRLLKQKRKVGAIAVATAATTVTPTTSAAVTIRSKKAR